MVTAADTDQRIAARDMREKLEAQVREQGYYPLGATLPKPVEGPGPVDDSEYRR